jgi:hypothetical protein
VAAIEERAREAIKLPLTLSAALSKTEPWAAIGLDLR